MSQSVLFLKQNSVVVFWVAVFQNMATYWNHRCRISSEIRTHTYTVSLQQTWVTCDMNGITETLNRYNIQHKSLIQLSADICIYDKPQPLTWVRISKHRKQTEVKRKTQLGQKFCSGVRTCGDWTVSWQRVQLQLKLVWGALTLGILCLPQIITDLQHSMRGIEIEAARRWLELERERWEFISFKLQSWIFILS